jgi:hypothetical protein
MGTMTRPLPFIAGLLGVVFLVLAGVYCFVPAGGLPSFLPAFDVGSEHVHLNHAIGSLIVAHKGVKNATMASAHARFVTDVATGPRTKRRRAEQADGRRLLESSCSACSISIATCWLETTSYVASRASCN